MEIKNKVLEFFTKYGIKAWIGLAIIVVAVVSLCFVGGEDKKEMVQEQAPVTLNETALIPEGVDNTSPEDIQKPKTTPVTPLTYAQALKQYGDRRLQFDNACQVRPYPNLTYKNGVSIMIDNRSKTPRTIKFGPRVYSLGSYGFKIVTLSSNTLPEKILIDCGVSQNVGTIILQK